MSPDVFLSRRPSPIASSLFSLVNMAVDPVGQAIILLRCKAIFHLWKLGEKGGEK